MKPGYKQTDVGVIPEDWRLERLGTICDVRDGTHDSPRFFETGVPFVTSKNIVNGQIDLTNVSYISEVDAFEFDKRSKVDRNDIIMSMIGTIGSAVLVDFDPKFCIKNVALIKPRKVGPPYLIHHINSPSFQRYLESSLDGGIQKFVSLGTLRQLLIPVPNEIEQHAIAEAMSDVDGLLGGLDRLIAKKRDLKQAAMQQLLTGQTRLPGFHGEWEVKRLGDIAEMGSGGTPSSAIADYYDGDIPWVSIADMTKCGKIIMTTDRNLTRAGFSSCSAKMFPAGTVLYAMYASLGECSIAGISVCSSQAILGIRTRSGLSNEFLYYYLTSLKSVVKSLGQQGTQANLNKGMVQDFCFSLPPLPEQTAIAEILSDMDAEVTALEQRREKTRALKQAMMQELLTGKTRLV